MKTYCKNCEYYPRLSGCFTAYSDKNGAIIFECKKNIVQPKFNEYTELLEKKGISCNVKKENSTGQCRYYKEYKKEEPCNEH